MTTLPVEDVDPAPARPFGSPWLLWALSALALVLIGVLGFGLGQQTMSPPNADSVDAGFAYDMSVHHAQAVNMAHLLYDRTTDPEMRQLALDIMLTQQGQIGQMSGWLNTWGLPLANMKPAMSWMGHPTTDLMPGMATSEDLQRLSTSQGVEADGLFLTLMIPHHRGGVAMANAVLPLTTRTAVRALAQAIVNSQTSEIAAMQDLLQRKGFPPVPAAIPTMDHNLMTP